MSESLTNSQEAGYCLTHNMCGVGALGNFLFVAASLTGIGLRTGRNVDLPDVVSRKFTRHFRNPVPSTSQRYDPGFREVAPAGKYNAFYNQLYAVSNSTSKHRVVLTGYLQSWKYFNDSASRIRWQMVFTWSVYQQALAVLETKLLDFVSGTGFVPETLIGVHVRRGDILEPYNTKVGHIVASDEYILNAVSRLNATYTESVFVVISNDPAYCRELLGRFDNVIFFEENPAEVDMAILTLMDHLVLTVGSFGWWAAYLSDAKDVYYYKGWPRRNSDLEGQYRHGDYFLPHWKGME